jgi:hypothetical protein
MGSSNPSIYQHFDDIPPGILNCSSYSQSDNNDGSSSRHSDIRTIDRPNLDTRWILKTIENRHPL